MTDAAWFQLEAGLHWAGVGLYALAFGLFTSALFFGKPARARAGWWAALAGLLPHAIALLIRWASSGHGPYMLKYEVLSSNAWIAVLALVLFVRLRAAWAPVAVVALPLAILAMAVGLFSSPEVRDLPPSLRSIWLVFHILFAKLSAASFVLSIGTAGAVLGGSRVRARWRERLPAEAVLNAYTVRFIGFGFVFWTVTIAAGAVWADLAWGRYWGWDAIETWSFVSWLVYGAFLHVRLFYRLGARATSWWAVGSFAAFVLAGMILPFVMPSLHAAYMQ